MTTLNRVLLGLAILAASPFAMFAMAEEDTSSCFTAIYALKEGRLGEAIDLYTRCIDTGNLAQRNLIVAHNDRGNAYGRQGRYEQALADFNAVIALNEKDPDAFYNRGLTHKRLRQINEALADYDQAIALNPKYSKAYNNRGSIYGERGLFQRAIGDFDKAISLNASDASAWFNRGLAHYSTGNYWQAVKDLERAIELNPDYIKAYENLAWLRATCPEEELRDGIMAVALAKKARFLRPEGTPGLYDILAAAYASQGSYDEAVQYQRLALDRAAPPNRAPFEQRLELYKQGTSFEDKGGNRFLQSS